MITRPSVMVVDDDKELADFLKHFLKGLVLTLLSSTDPIAALDHYSQNPDKYSVVITDWKMAFLDGIHC